MSNNEIKQEHKGMESTIKKESSKKVWITLLIAVVVLAIAWIVEQRQINNLKKEAAIEKQQVQATATALMLQTQQESLKLLAKPFVWAVRTEMLKGNISQVSLYENEMVKEKNVQRIVVADDKGVIVAATDKKLEGKVFTIVGKPVYLSSDTTIVEKTGDSTLVMSSPVMGFNNRLGTLLITYTIQPPHFKLTYPTPSSFFHFL